MDLLDVVVDSIIAQDAVPVKDDWTLFAYLGDTKYNIHLFQAGEEKAIVSHHEFGEVCNAAARWFGKEAMTTLPPPPSAAFERVLNSAP